MEPGKREAFLHLSEWLLFSPLSLEGVGLWNYAKWIWIWTTPTRTFNGFNVKRWVFFTSNLFYLVFIIFMVVKLWIHSDPFGMISLFSQVNHSQSRGQGYFCDAVFCFFFVLCELWFDKKNCSMNHDWSVFREGGNAKDLGCESWIDNNK